MRLFPSVTLDLPPRCAIIRYPFIVGFPGTQRPSSRCLFVVTSLGHRFPSDQRALSTPWSRLAVPISTARRGLPPPRSSPCPAHKDLRRKQRGIRRVPIDDLRITSGTHPLVGSHTSLSSFHYQAYQLCWRNTRRAISLHPIIAPSPKGLDGKSPWQSDS